MKISDDDRKLIDAIADRGEPLRTSTPQAEAAFERFSAEFERAYELVSSATRAGESTRIASDSDGYLIEVGRYTQKALDRFKNDAGQPETTSSSISLLTNAQVPVSVGSLGMVAGRRRGLTVFRASNAEGESFERKEDISRFRRTHGF